MSREEFGREFVRCMRFVIQKHDRANETLRTLRKIGTTPTREQAYAEAQTNLDAALIQLGDHLYDAITSEAGDDATQNGSTPEMGKAVRVHGSTRGIPTQQPDSRPSSLRT